MVLFFFFQAEDGIRDLVRSRGLGDVYKRQALLAAEVDQQLAGVVGGEGLQPELGHQLVHAVLGLSLIHI